MTYQKTYQQDLEGFYIKANEVSQSKSGDVYNVPYLDDGQFKMIVFNKQKNLDSVNFNLKLNIDNETRPIHGFAYPMMSAVFTDSSNIFVSIYHS